MKRQDLHKLLGEDMGYWEIVNVGYNEGINTIELKLQEFVWQPNAQGRDFKEYLPHFKKLDILDEFAFNYYEDNKRINAMEKYMEYHHGLNKKHLEHLLNSPDAIFTTSIQHNWNNALRLIGVFNEERYKQQFLQEYKKWLINYHAEHPEETSLLEYIQFFDSLSKGISGNGVD